jgi:hypothetical protein
MAIRPTQVLQTRKECKANGKSVRSILGRGNQGHLGLVSSVLTYKHVSPGVHFDRPVLPVLPDLTNGTIAQIAEARQQYTGNMETFKACNLIERTIIQQINTVIDEDCLTDLIDDETGLLEGTVPLLDKHENSNNKNRRNREPNPRNREPRCIYTIEY